MKNKLKLITFTLIGIMLFSGCGTTKNATKSAKTYNCSKIYETAQTQLENSILDEDTYKSLSDTLAAYEKKDLKKLSKKDAKKVKTICSEIESYYEASEQSIQDTLSQLGSVYPTDESFYDDTFKTNTTNLFTEFNALMDEGKYKEAGMKLNEITSAYTAYVESKGQTVKADVTVDANKTASIKAVIASNKNSTKDSANTGTSGSSANTYTENPVANAGNNGNTNNVSTSNNNASNNGTIANTNTASTSNKNNTPSSNTGSSNSSGNINSSNHNSNTSTPAPAPTRIPYSWTCPECGAVITGYKGEDDNVNEHAHMHTDEEANAFKYVTGADNAYGAWCDSPECDATIPYDTWLDTHGYSSSLYHQYCQKYGWE